MSRLLLHCTEVGITFIVDGVPAPQGSKNPWGGEANPRTRPWRAAVSAEAARAMGDREALLGPVAVKIVFAFPRPKSHYGSGRNAGILKESAPIYHTTYPDLDKLQRAIGDALTGVAIRDDKQIAYWDVVKVYDSRAGARVRITPLEVGGPVHGLRIEYTSADPPDVSDLEEMGAGRKEAAS